MIAPCPVPEKQKSHSCTCVVDRGVRGDSSSSQPPESFVHFVGSLGLWTWAGLCPCGSGICFLLLSQILGYVLGDGGLELCSFASMWDSNLWGECPASVTHRMVRFHSWAGICACNWGTCLLLLSHILGHVSEGKPRGSTSVWAGASPDLCREQCLS